MARTQRVRVYLAGPAGVGKTTVAQALAARYGCQRIGLGDLVREECAHRGLDPTRANLQPVGDAIRTEHDDDAALARLALDRALPGARGVVVDGVRLVAEAEALREAGWIGVGVWAEPEARERRLLARDGAADVPRHRTEGEADRVRVDIRFETAEEPVRFRDGLEWLVSRVAALAATRAARALC